MYILLVNKIMADSDRVRIQDKLAGHNHNYGIPQLVINDFV